MSICRKDLDYPVCIQFAMLSYALIILKFKAEKRRIMKSKISQKGGVHIRLRGGFLTINPLPDGLESWFFGYKGVFGASLSLLRTRKTQYQLVHYHHENCGESNYTKGSHL